MRVSTGLLKIHKIHLQASCNYLYHWYTILLEDSLENGVIKAAWDTAGGGCLEKSREESMTVVVCCRNTGGIKKKCSCDKIMASDNHNARLRRQDWRGNKRQDLYNFLSFKPHNVTTEDCGKLLMLLEKNGNIQDYDNLHFRTVYKLPVRIYCNNVTKTERVRSKRRVQIITEIGK